MSMREAAERHLGEKALKLTEAFGELTCEVGAGELLEVARVCRDEEELHFEFLSDLTGIDAGGGRYEVVYHLLSIKHGRRLRLKVALAEGEEVDSVVGIWPTADWHERESYDMVGIVFRGHPGLERILTPEGFKGHPLRKGYPLRGEEQ